MSDWSYIDGFYTTKRSKEPNSVYIPRLGEYLVPTYFVRRSTPIDELWNQTIGDTEILHNGLVKRTCYDGVIQKRYPTKMIPDGKCVAICTSLDKIANAELLKMSGYGEPVYVYHNTFPDLHSAMENIPKYDDLDYHYYQGYMISMIINLETKKSMVRINNGCWCSEEEDNSLICINRKNPDDEDEGFKMSTPYEPNNISLSKAKFYVVIQDDSNNLIDRYSFYDEKDVKSFIGKYLSNKEIDWNHSEILGYNPLWIAPKGVFIYILDKDLNCVEQV